MPWSIAFASYGRVHVLSLLVGPCLLSPDSKSTNTSSFILSVPLLSLTLQKLVFSDDFEILTSSDRPLPPLTVMRHLPTVSLLFAALFIAFQGGTLAHPVLYELRLRTTPDAMLAASPYAIVPRFQLDPSVSADNLGGHAVSLRSLWIDEARRRQENGQEEEMKRFKPEDFFLHPPPHRHGRRHVQ
jgi:hypothetical protein